MSSGPMIVCATMHCETFATMFRCVSSTPFGSPDVPEEYGIAATCVAGSNVGGGGVGAPGFSSAAKFSAGAGKFSDPMT